jgi:hypothetical protein
MIVGRTAAQCSRRRRRRRPLLELTWREPSAKSLRRRTRLSLLPLGRSTYRRLCRPSPSNASPWMSNLSRGLHIGRISDGSLSPSLRITRTSTDFGGAIFRDEMATAAAIDRLVLIRSFWNSTCRVSRAERATRRGKWDAIIEGVAHMTEGCGRCQTHGRADAPTGLWKSLRDSHKRPQAIIGS